MKSKFEDALPDVLWDDEWYQSWKEIKELAHSIDILNGGTDQDKELLFNLSWLKEELPKWIKVVQNRIDLYSEDEE
jgi:hypothetical protein